MIQESQEEVRFLNDIQPSTEQIESHETTPGEESRDYKQIEDFERNENIKQNRSLRKDYAGWIKWTVIAYLFIVITIVVIVGAGILDLSDSVLITLLSTTTANVIGLAWALVRGLFPTEK